VNQLHSTTHEIPITTALQQSAEEADACLVRIYPPSIGEGIINLPKQPTIIGRSRSCDLVVDDRAVSRQHSCIYYKNNGYRIKDLDSHNSTIVNDNKIRKVRLKPGDLIRIGHRVFKFLSSDHVERQYHEEIYSMMISDGLTGIPNKRYFMDVLEREVSRSQRHNRPLSLVLFDIDHFKKVNDQHGHLVGDFILRDLCSRVAPYVRKDEVFARYGGEEFAIILSEVSREQAYEVVEKILVMIMTEDFEVDGIHIPITVSIGIQELNPKRHRTVNDLIEAADRKLYRAKKNGRNCIVN
jgi:diguanylate cyclase (GGDEF)-like protein